MTLYLLQILICLTVVSIAQAALVTRIPKPKLSSTFSQKLTIPEFPKHKSPEERRKFSLFPKSYMKYVISPEPIYKIATHKPIVHRTKKPLMKKLNLLDKQNIVLENETEQLISNAEPKHEDALTVIPIVDNVVTSEEASVEVVQDKSEESIENKDVESKEETLKNDDSQEDDEVKNNSNELKIETPDSEILILETMVKQIELGEENKILDGSADVMDKKENSKDVDWMEFILVDPTHKPTESDKMSSEELEEFVTTEFYGGPESNRVKR